MPSDAPELTARGLRTAERLRIAAREVFGELGYQATRVQDVAERAGVSHGTFYTYYENKSAVLVDLVREASRAFEVLAEEPWEAEDVRGALERVIGGFLDRYAADAAVMRAWLQAAREERDFSALYLEVRRRFVDRITEQVDAVLAASGRVGAPPAATVASALAAMVEHFAYCWAVLGEPHDRGDAVDALALVWGGGINALAGFELVRTARR